MAADGSYHLPRFKKNEARHRSQAEFIARTLEEHMPAKRRAKSKYPKVTLRERPAALKK